MLSLLMFRIEMFIPGFLIVFNPVKLIFPTIYIRFIFYRYYLCHSLYFDPLLCSYAVFLIVFLFRNTTIIFHICQ